MHWRPTVYPYPPLPLPYTNISFPLLHLAYSLTCTALFSTLVYFALFFLSPFILVTLFSYHLPFTPFTIPLISSLRFIPSVSALFLLSLLPSFQSFPFFDSSPLHLLTLCLVPLLCTLLSLPVLSPLISSFLSFSIPVFSFCSFPFFPFS